MHQGRRRRNQSIRSFYFCEGEGEEESETKAYFTANSQKQTFEPCCWLNGNRSIFAPLHMQGARCIKARLTAHNFPFLFFFHHSSSSSVFPLPSQSCNLKLQSAQANLEWRGRKRENGVRRRKREISNFHPIRLHHQRPTFSSSGISNISSLLPPPPPPPLSVCLWWDPLVLRLGFRLFPHYDGGG